MDKSAIKKLVNVLRDVVRGTAGDRSELRLAVSNLPTKDIQAIQSCVSVEMPRVEVTCPECEEKTTLVGTVEGGEYGGTIDIYSCNDELYFDWSTGDYDLIISYYCENCGSRLADNLQELEEMYRKELAEEYEKECEEVDDAE